MMSTDLSILSYKVSLLDKQLETDTLPMSLGQEASAICDTQVFLIPGFLCPTSQLLKTQEIRLHLVEVVQAVPQAAFYPLPSRKKEKKKDRLYLQTLSFILMPSS